MITSNLAVTFLLGLVILRGAKPYSMKVAEETERELNALLEQATQDGVNLLANDDDPVAPSAMAPLDAIPPSPSSHLEEYQQAQYSSGGGSSVAHPKSRWATANSHFQSNEDGESGDSDSLRSCPSRYEEIIGYCADSPIGNPLAFSRERCASQCNLNQDCLGFSWDKDADGKTKPYSCTLQHTECRFPTYSTRFGFCRKKQPKPQKPSPPPPPPPPPPVLEASPYDLPPIRITEEPNTEILRAYLSTYDQICDSDKNFKTQTVFTCAQYCLADAGCQAFSYDNSLHVCRFIGHCQQKQVFKKLFGSSGMPDILSLLNFILSRANSPPSPFGPNPLAGPGSSALSAAAALLRPPPPQPLAALPGLSGLASLMTPVMPAPYKPYSPAEERYLYSAQLAAAAGAEERAAYHHHHRHRHSREYDESSSSERRALRGYERMQGDCQSPLLDNKVYELNVYECARKCHRRADCSGFSVNLFVSSPHECYLRAESCSSPITSSAWVYYRKLDGGQATSDLNDKTYAYDRPPPRGGVAAPVHREDPAAAQLAAKSEKLFAFYDFLQNNLNKTSPQAASILGAASAQMKKIPRSRNLNTVSNDHPMMARRSLISANAPNQALNTNNPTQNNIPRPLNDGQFEKRQEEKVLQYYTPLQGNCRGDVIEQVKATLGECAIRCIHTSKCLGFAFDQFENKCYIKSNKCVKPEPSDNGIVYYQLRM